MNSGGQVILLRYFQLAVLIILFHFPLKAQVSLSEDYDIYNINSETLVYATRDTIHGTEAWEKIVKGNLRKVLNKTNPGISNSAYWIKIPITNKANETSFYLEVDYPQLDYLQLYEVSNDSVIHLFETGDRYVFDQRPVNYRNFTFPITIQKGDSKTFLLNIDKRLSATRFPLTLYKDSAFWDMYNKEAIFYGFCFGSLVFVILISLLVGLRLGMSIFVWYSLYVLTFGLRCFAKLGYGYQFLISDYPNLNIHFFPFTTQLAMVFLILYIQNYFNTKSNLPKFNRVMDVILGLFLISSIIWIFFPSFIIKAGPVLISMRYIVVSTIIIFAYYSALKHLKHDAFKAKIFMVGYSMFFLGVFSQILIEYGAINSSLVPGDALFAGFFMEIGVLSYAMVVMLVKIIKEKNQLIVSNSQLQNRLEQLRNGQSENSYVRLKSKAVINPARIKYIQSDDHYIEFYLDDKARPEVDRNKLTSILDVLPPQFVQIHRSTIVNLEFVRTIYGNYLLLNDGEELKLSRTYKSQLEERLAK